MGSLYSTEFNQTTETNQSKQHIIDDLREVLKDIRKRLVRLETENAVMNKMITNLKVSNNEMGRSVTKIHELAFKERIMNEGRPPTSRSVRQPKGARSLFVK